jgi:nucleotide-binding universal stress UspA family protein
MATKPYVIVAGTDYSSHGYRAVRSAAREATKHPFSKLYVVHVETVAEPEEELPPIAFAGFGTKLAQHSRSDSLNQLDEHVAAALSNLPLPSELSVETMVRKGEPAYELMELGWKLRANLLVVGTRGRKYSSTWALGSVAETVVRQAISPVLVVGPRVHLTPEVEAKVALS